MSFLIVLFVLRHVTRFSTTPFGRSRIALRILIVRLGGVVTAVFGVFVVELAGVATAIFLCFTRFCAFFFHRTGVAFTTTRLHRTTRLGLLLLLTSLRGLLGHHSHEPNQQQPEQHDQNSALMRFHFVSPWSLERSIFVVFTKRLRQFAH
jgi:hypothetical protein